MSMPSSSMTSMVLNGVRLKELEEMLKPKIVQPKVPPGVDPKSIVCEFWRAGCCQKGEKCRYAHDLNAGKKSAKIDIYTDRRTLQSETMEDWDQETLESVVEKKRSERNRKNQTTIVCKYFLEALEQNKYGWFWECPNGDNCIYVHALPPGFVLKKKESALARDPGEEDQGPTLEEVIEVERAKVKDGRPVTAESFAEWKAAKMARMAAEEKKKEEEKAKAVKQGKTVLLSGRELLIYKPEMFVDDQAAMDTTELEVMPDEEYDAQLNATSELQEMLNANAAAICEDVDESLFEDDEEETPAE